MAPKAGRGAAPGAAMGRGAAQKAICCVSNYVCASAGTCICQIVDAPTSTCARALGQAGRGAAKSTPGAAGAATVDKDALEASGMGPMICVNVCS